MFPGAGPIQLAVGSIKISDSTQKRQELILARELPAVEIGVLGSISHNGSGRNSNWTGSELRLSDRCAKIGITAEELDFVLGFGRDCHARGECGQDEELEE